MPRPPPKSRIDNQHVETPQGLDLPVLLLPEGELPGPGLPVLLRRRFRARPPAGPELGVSPQLDVRSPARHVGGYGHRTPGPRLGDDHGLPGVVFGVQHLVADAAPGEHPGQQLRFFDGHRPHQHGLAFFVDLPDLIADGLEFVRFVQVDQVILVRPDNGAVGGDDDHVQVVDLAELLGLRVRRAGHAGDLFVHPEKILEGHSGQGPVPLRHPD